MLPYISVLGRELPAYGVMCALAILTALAGGLLRARALRLSAYATLMIFTCALCAGFLGAFVLYALVTYGARELILMLGGASDRQFQIGFVFYGGLIGGLAGAFAAARACRARLSDYSRALTPFLALAHAVGRVGCHLAGCCFGIEARLCPGVIYPEHNLISGATKGVGLVPVQLIEAGILIVIFIILCVYTKKPRRLGALWLYALLYAPARFMLEFLRGDAARGMAGGLSTSQWLSACALAAALARAVYVWAQSARKFS